MGQFSAAREQVVATCRALLERGYLKATEGNVSVRVPGRDAFAITPTNYDYAKMKAADICVLDFALERLEGERKASIESGMHAAVYQERPDVNAIVHTHQPYASALALVRQPIPALFDEQVRFLGRSVEIIDYAPSGTGFLKKNVRKRITSGDNAFILANHGVLVLGGDVDRAVFNMALLEKVALDYLLALMTGEKVSKVPGPIREIAFAKLRGDEKKLKRQLEEAKKAESLAPAAAAGSAADAAPAAAACGDGRWRCRRQGRRADRGRRRPARRLRDQRVPGRRGRVRAPRRTREPAAAPHPAAGDGRVPRLLRDEVPPQPGAHRRSR